MSEQQDQRLLCPGCSHNVQGQDPQPDAFRYLTIDRMRAAGYRCQNNSCPVYIEEGKIFTRDVHNVSGHTTVPATPRNKTPVTPVTPVKARNKDTITTTNKAIGPGGQDSTPGVVPAPSPQPNSRGAIRNFWTEDEIDLLLEMRTRGHSWNQITEVGLPCPKL